VSPLARPGMGMGAMPIITGEASISTGTPTSTSTGQEGRSRDPPGQGARASNGSTTRSTGKGFPTATRGLATSIRRQTVRPWTTVRVTAVTTSRRQAHPIGPPASNRRRAHPIAPVASSRPNRIEHPIDQVPGQRARTTPSADQTAAGDKCKRTAQEAARACLRPSPTEAEAHPPGLPEEGRLAAAADEAADKMREENVSTSPDSEIIDGGKIHGFV
jgi:hypothetical protein